MKLFKAITVVCLFAFGVALTPAARAGDWDRKTTLTFSGPVEIPGVHLAGWSVLPAGTYVFKILDSQSDRHVVQIFNKEESVVYATILAIPNYRLKATDKTVVTFRERPAGEPEALRAWFYPGRNWGEEFVYSKAKAMELAKSTNTPVLFTQAELPSEVTEPIKPADEAVVAQLRGAPVMAVQPTGEEVPVAEVVTAPPAEAVTTPAPAEVAAAPAPMMEADRSSLPDTASTVPLVALFGLLALGGAMMCRIAEKRLQ